jgi:hypothetical protein
MTLDLAWFRKVVGLLASEHAGERSAAALKATAILRAAGKYWADVGVGTPSSQVMIVEAHDAAAMAAIYKMSLESEQARTTRLIEENTRLKREVARLKGMWPEKRTA